MNIQTIIKIKITKKKNKFMIIFDKLWETMKKNGISTYRLRESCSIDSKTIRRLKANDNMETKTLDKLCNFLNCNLEDIATYIKTENNK